MVKNLASLGKTVLLTTHYMDEAQFLADRVAVIAEGRFVAEGTPATLGGRRPCAARLRSRRLPRSRASDELSGTVATTAPELEAEDRSATLHELSGWALEHGRRPRRARDPRPSLEDVYLELTGPAPAAGDHRRPPAAGGRADERGPLALLPGALRQQDVLAQPASCVLHVRVPAHVPRHLHRAARPRHGRTSGRRPINESTYYVAAMAAFAVISVVLHQPRMAVTFQRETGVLKRVNGTPLPSGVVPRRPHPARAARRRLARRHHRSLRQVSYAAEMPSGITLLRFRRDAAVGSAASAPSGSTITAVIPNADAAAAIVNASILPLLFLSGDLHPPRRQRARMMVMGRRIFPVRHFARDPGGVHRRVVQLGGRARPPGLGTRRRPRRHTLLPLGTANRLTLGRSGEAMNPHAMDFQMRRRTGHPDFLDLPWHLPLAGWRHDRLVDVPRGISRHVVRFVRYGEAIYALKELPRRLAEREYRLLAELDRLFIPVVEVAGLVTDRGGSGGIVSHRTSPGTELEAILITRHLDFSLPYRRVLGATGTDAALSDRLLDALGESPDPSPRCRLLLGRLLTVQHPLPPRRRALSAPTSSTPRRVSFTAQLSDGQRLHDVMVAEENIAGELMDCDRRRVSSMASNPIVAAEELGRRYERIWSELHATRSHSPPTSGTGSKKRAPAAQRARLRRRRGRGGRAGRRVPAPVSSHEWWSRATTSGRCGH